MSNYLFLKPCRAERMTRSVVKTSQGTMTTSILNLRTAGMSLSTCGSWSKNQRRLQKMYVPPAKLLSRKKCRGKSKSRENCRIDDCQHDFQCFSLSHFFFKLRQPDTVSVCHSAVSLVPFADAGSPLPRAAFRCLGMICGEVAFVIRKIWRCLSSLRTWRGIIPCSRDCECQKQLQ